MHGYCIYSCMDICIMYVWGYVYQIYLGLPKGFTGNFLDRFAQEKPGL